MSEKVNNRIAPVLKWAGGKTQLLDAILPLIPADIDRYYEPFVGGGAICFALQPEKAVINDINPQLINLYRQIKLNAEQVIDCISELDSKKCDKEFYYSIRCRYNKKIASQENDPEMAALMIWLNKHCFNGLYRVNKRGLFNVPYNNRVQGQSIVTAQFRQLSNYLNDNDVKICCGDFELLAKQITTNDFVYIDSPYVPVSDTASFTDYAKTGFALAEHQRLAEMYRELDSRGVRMLLSNNDTPLVRELYAGYTIESIAVKRMINRNAQKRFGQEVLIRNY